MSSALRCTHVTTEVRLLHNTWADVWIYKYPSQIRLWVEGCYQSFVELRKNLQCMAKGLSSVSVLLSISICFTSGMTSASTASALESGTTTICTSGQASLSSDLFTHEAASDDQPYKPPSWFPFHHHHHNHHHIIFILGKYKTHKTVCRYTYILFMKIIPLMLIQSLNQIRFYATAKGLWSNCIMLAGCRHC